jgi:hypothetical protein
VIKVVVNVLLEQRAMVQILLEQRIMELARMALDGLRVPIMQIHQAIMEMAAVHQEN